ncbi:hypothetical protein ILYODFUR_032732 [Ilyodon furcidens]|uniref:Glycine cleavage system P-protein N-terminal domain-containing protein n=1 Tax=Ilyodon furcidens TaxID=33524 RepID=A0ABV0UX63_9TELE
MQSCAKSWRLFVAKSVNPSAPCGHLSERSSVVWKLQSRIRLQRSSASLTTAAAGGAARGLRTSAAAASRQIERILPRHDDFAERHIGPGEREKREMLDVLALESVDQLIENTVPPSIRIQRSLKMDDPICKFRCISSCLSLEFENIQQF